MFSHICYIGIGSNTQSARNVSWALEQLNLLFEDVRHSTPLETEPIGFRYNRNKFCNMVVCCRTDLPASRVVSLLKGLEKRAGRRPEDKLKERVLLDLDLIIYDSLILKPKDLRRPFMASGIKELNGLSSSEA